MNILRSIEGLTTGIGLPRVLVSLSPRPDIKITDVSESDNLEESCDQKGLRVNIVTNGQSHEGRLQDIDMLVLTEIASKINSADSDSEEEPVYDQESEIDESDFEYELSLLKDSTDLWEFIMMDFKKIREDVNWVMHDLSIATRKYQKKMDQENERGPA